MAGISERNVLDALSRVVHPQLHQDMVTLDAVKNVSIREGDVSFKIVLPVPSGSVKNELASAVKEAVMKISGVRSVSFDMSFEVPKDPRLEGQNVSGDVKSVVAVASGKGGVGKSTVAVNMAVALRQMGAAVGIMDADMYGPNVPMMLGLGDENGPKISDGKKIIPMDAFGVKAVSISYFVDGSKPIIWRGPMLHKMLDTFVKEVEWGKLDYLIVDMPPGTGDIQISLSQLVPVSGAVVVTTPQDVSLSDVVRAVVMFKQVEIPVLGVVENMSAFACPHCGKETEIFKRGGGERIAEEFGVPLLGCIPIDPAVCQGGDSGRPVVVSVPDSAVARAFYETARAAAWRVSLENRKIKDYTIKRASPSGPRVMEV